MSIPNDGHVSSEIDMDMLSQKKLCEENGMELRMLFPIKTPITRTRIEEYLIFPISPLHLYRG